MLLLHIRKLMFQLRWWCGWLLMLCNVSSHFLRRHHQLLFLGRRGRRVRRLVQGGRLHCVSKKKNKGMESNSPFCCFFLQARLRRERGERKVREPFLNKNIFFLVLQKKRASLAGARARRASSFGICALFALNVITFCCSRTNPFSLLFAVSP